MKSKCKSKRNKCNLLYPVIVEKRHHKKRDKSNIILLSGYTYHPVRKEPIYQLLDAFNMGQRFK
jgi:hypothetical protein